MLPEEASFKLDIGIFNEDDPYQHFLKVLVGNGMYVALRGYDEHVLLQTCQIRTGVYPKSHPFSGMTWAGIDLKNRKSNKIRPNNVYFNDDSSVNRQPVWDDSPTSSCWAGSLIRFREKFGPGQGQFYCRAAVEPMLSGYKKQGFLSAVYNPSEPMNRNDIGKAFKAAARIMGFKDWEKVTGHMFRRLAVTKLVNHPHVNLSESMELTGHKSVSAHLAYIQKDATSEVERVKALLDPEAIQKINHSISVIDDKVTALKNSKDISEDRGKVVGKGFSPVLELNDDDFASLPLDGVDLDDTSLSDCKVSTITTDSSQQLPKVPKSVQVCPIVSPVAVGNRANPYNRAVPRNGTVFVEPSVASRSSISQSSLDLKQQVRALTNRGRALEIRLRNLTKEKKQMEERFEAMVADRDSEIQEKDERIHYLDETISDLRGQLRWNRDQKEMYYRRR